MKLRRTAALAGPLALLLAGCSSLPWMGDEDTPLPGTRVPVMLLGDGPSADPMLADVPVQLPPARPSETWPQDGGSASHAPGHLAAPASLKRAWSAGIGEGAAGGARLLGRPVVADGKVFAVDGAGSVTAVSAGDGRRVWRWEPEGRDGSDRLGGGGLAFADGRLYVTESWGEVAALDAASGTELWRRNLLAPIRSAPAFAEGRVLVRTADNQLFVLGAAEGDVLWRHAGLFEQTGILGASSPAVVGERVIVTYSSGEVFALALADGSPIWTDTLLRPRRTLAIGTISDITGAPAVADGRVFLAGSGGETAAFSLGRGDRLWDHDLTSLFTPWPAGEFVFLASERGELISLLAGNGRIRWVAPLNAAAAKDETPALWAGPVLAGGRLLLASSSGVLASVSPANGEILERLSFPGRATQPPVVAGGTVYILTDGGELHAFR
ncbi:outer membrane protein assembly factor BamB family protein [Marinimicrococcus flavescens]|uniref:PQQ-binding-like beta-propeller repeat protein n=1 Tax=Marinimicrococcus flavescens TaxID=3031815 RepID=A0AAP4D5M4_9PROT|nr:PQQ-binding-like beta-propeller repeat protein [Marinimicrococcus flavescens]